MVYNRRSLRYWLEGIYWLLIKRKFFKGESLTSVQRFFTDGYFHKHCTASELKQILTLPGLTDFRVSVTHMAKQMMPGQHARTAREGDGLGATSITKRNWMRLCT
jgi:hypothetical protein